MFRRFSSLCLLIAVCVFTGQGCQRQSILLEPAEIIAKGLEKDDAYSFYFLSTEKFAHPPVALLQRQPKLPGETQRFDLFLYRNIGDVKEVGEKITCQAEQSNKYTNKDGSLFKVSISFSREEEYPFEISINGNNGSVTGVVKIANFTASEEDDVPVGEVVSGESSP